MNGGVMLGVLLWLQQVPPRALVLAMALSYVLCFAGMLFAYLAYRRRRRLERRKDDAERLP